jgi:hypothetical protein
MSAIGTLSWGCYLIVMKSIISICLLRYGTIVGYIHEYIVRFRIVLPHGNMRRYQHLLSLVRRSPASRPGSNALMVPDNGRTVTAVTGPPWMGSGILGRAGGFLAGTGRVCMCKSNRHFPHLRPPPFDPRAIFRDNPESKNAIPKKFRRDFLPH